MKLLVWKDLDQVFPLPFVRETIHVGHGVNFPHVVSMSLNRLPVILRLGNLHKDTLTSINNLAGSGSFGSECLV